MDIRPRHSCAPAWCPGKSKLADACIDAASLMQDPVQDLIARGQMSPRAPLHCVSTFPLPEPCAGSLFSQVLANRSRSWLFASSLILGLGLLGGFGRIIEKYSRTSITALEYFAKNDAHAMQYSLIANSMLVTALQYLDKKETPGAASPNGELLPALRSHPEGCTRRSERPAAHTRPDLLAAGLQPVWRHSARC